MAYEQLLIVLSLWILNKGRDKKCLVHTEQEVELEFQTIKSQRPYLKSNYVDTVKAKKMKEMRNQMSLQETSVLFNKLRIQPNENLVSEKEVKKLKKKTLFEKNELQSYLLKRTKVRNIYF